MSKMNLTEVSSALQMNSQLIQLLKIEGFVFVTFLLLLVLLPCRFFRRRHKSWLLKALDLIANASMFLLIPFIFGMMLSLDFKHQLVPVWASFLVFVFANVPDGFHDSSALSFGLAYAKFSLYWVYVVVMIYRVQYSSLCPPLIVLIVGSFFGLAQKVSGPLTVTSVANVEEAPRTFRYLPECLLDRPNNDDNTSPSDGDPLLECKYVVDPEDIKFDRGKIVDPGITIDKIWSCEDGSLLTSTKGNGLKNTCLSFSLFWTLLRKCKGVPSYERSEPEQAWKFVRDGLLRFSSPLKLIEVELAFLGDYYFSRYISVAYGQLGFLFLIVQQLMFMGGISWLIMLMFESYHPGDQTLMIQYYGHYIDVDVLVTVIGIISLTLLQLSRIVGFFTSRWAKVRLIRIYLSRESWKRKTIWDRFIKTAAQILCPVPYHLNKPWERKVGQYSLLHSFSHNRSSTSWFLNRMCTTYTGINYGRPGRVESDPKTMSNEIEKSVIQSLRDRGPQLTSGIGSLEASDLPNETLMKLTRACMRSPKLDTHAQVVLAWHIATSICETSPQLTSSASECCDFQVANTLSKYCAYLVAFAPDLLPGHALTTDYTCTYAIHEAYTLLSDCEASNMYDKLIEFASDDPEDAQRNTGSILQQGAVLGMVLEMEVIDECKRWKVLADFWAEMVLYLAPNANNAQVHIEKLADGGEFITLLWALLFHAGIDSLDKRAS